MPDYALVKDGTVDNVVVWDGDESTWQPPAGFEAIEVTEETGGASPGFAWDGVHFVPPPPEVLP